MTGWRSNARPHRLAGAGAIAVAFARRPRPAELDDLAKRGADLFELRLDLTEVRNARETELLCKSFAGHNMLATARSTEEGGAADDDSLRLEMLRAAARHACALDVELSSANIIGAIADTCGEFDCELIVSFHDHRSTPHLDMLRATMDKAFASGAAIFKAAVKLNQPADTDTLSALLAEGARAGRRIAIMGIGKNEIARDSRLRLARQGSAYVFAHAGEPTADGQPGLDWLAQQLDQP